MFVYILNSQMLDSYSGKNEGYEMLQKQLNNKTATSIFEHHVFKLESSNLFKFF